MKPFVVVRAGSLGLIVPLALSVPFMAAVIVTLALFWGWLPHAHPVHHHPTHYLSDAP